MADGPDLSQIVRRTVQANAKFYKGWMDLSFEYWRGISEIFGGATEPANPVPEMDAGAGALIMEGEAGALVRGSFLVSNDMDRPVSCVFVATDFRDPAGATVMAKAGFDPPKLDLSPGEQRVVQVNIAIDDALQPGVGYAGEISIGGMEGFAVPVVLRRQHHTDDLGVRDDEADADKRGSSPNETRASRGKPASRKGSRKKTGR